ncbi:MAG: metal-sensing transcriptional repressor [Candidatus Peribacter sp.]|jgi:DNA-binding FrmR family transcriptional regulator|nr:metal-sensing transcriptional repressor [Candidatus Peribacter sp.]MBT7337136.1 metal-sensing transcriptional repressor [Candidatus Peregrinibacteria bacterium]MBT4392865.1 metal-sensing transcriptional repressor [Candidatus Peribacter sp.]MBT4601349.1 metal-sensing transcriptional repressor [Candidatus Peribacter sp.]MBT5149399.1 metal-sensing transcriptional repressor [Candidatus Peribacter sp.]
MLPDQKAKALAALKRLDGLSKKVATQMDENEHCPEILRNVLAMKGHLDGVQEHILESHMHTCAEKNLSSPKDKDAFIKELLTVIGLSKR